MAIYKMTDGRQVKIPAKAAKALVMKEMGWTAAQYQKEYDLFKNRLRAYESYRAARGDAVKPESPAKLLYATAKGKANARKSGTQYVPSIKMQTIMSFPAVSITQGRKLAKSSGRYSSRRDKLFEAATQASFNEFIRDNPKAAEIVQKIKNPVLQEKALAELADKVHAQTRQKPGGAIPIQRGEAIGSNDDPGFDVDEWMAENDVE